MTRPLLTIVLMLSLFACADPAGEPGKGQGDTGDDARTDPEPDADTGNDVTPDVALAGTDLLRALSGLWSGPATNTPLGSFPVMAMDIRPSSNRVLFSQVDVDGENNLFFAFAVETHTGEGLGGADDVLVFRNGGAFQTANRESWTVLREHEPDRSWRFCSMDRGCDYIDARFDLDGDDLALDVLVKGEDHLRWRPRRVETRDTDEGFPASPATTGSRPELPPLPSLEVRASWREPLEASAEVWVVLSTTKCGVTGRGCTASRSRRTVAEAGATEATFTIENVHPGAYFANSVLDRNRNFVERLFPDAEDDVSFPDTAVTVSAAGDNVLELRVTFPVP